MNKKRRDMSLTTQDYEQIRLIIREEFDVLKEELRKEYDFNRLEFMLKNVETVSDEEQAEIDELYGEPENERASIILYERK
jgi:hypothetical protein